MLRNGWRVCDAVHCEFPASAPIIYTVAPEVLVLMLKRAAAADGWTRVIRRCAWCRRCLDTHGAYVDPASLQPHTVVTDGMCPTCGTQALADLAQRRALAA
jgi:hypothetical protein